MDSDKDKYNTHGTPGGNEEADTASGGAPEKADSTSKKGRTEEKHHDEDDHSDE